jgi:hypothetical protein
MLDDIMNLLRLKGHFRRWKSLTLSIATLYTPRIIPEDSFTNLESFIVLSIVPHPILTRINHTTTSKLQMLDLLRSSTRYTDIKVLYGVMLQRVTRLILPTITRRNTVDALPPIPARVAYIDATLRSDHVFPHVKIYQLTTGIFRAGNTFDLRSLTTLVVISSITVEKGCHMVLPSLRHFTCGHIRLNEEAALDAPQLSELEFRKSPTLVVPGPTRTRFDYIKDILDHPGFLLAPTESLSLALPLPADLIMRMLTRYSRLEKLELELNDDRTVWNVTVALGGRIGESGALCPQLTKLTLRIAPEYRGRHRVGWWEDRAQQIVHGRRNCAAALHISHGT